MNEQSLKLKSALKELLGWIPEASLPSHYAEATGWDLEDAKMSDGAPFFSEAFLYVLFGKDDARTLLSRLRKVCEAAGFDMWDLEREIYEDDKT